MQSSFAWLDCLSDFCISVLRDFGECCESVPFDHSGSYISISIKQNIYITRILAHVVQVDASLL